MKSKLLVLVLVTASLISSAQTAYFKKSIQGTHIHDYSLSAISAKDGGLYAMGFDRDTESFVHPYIMKVDSACNPQWRKRLTGNAGMISQLSLLIQLHGGDLLGVETAPYSAPVHPKSLIRFDEDGNVKWSKSYDTYTQSIITSLSADSATGNIKLGVVDYLDDVQGIIELDSTGTILNRQLISLGSFSFGGCLPAPGGGFYFGGANGSQGIDWDAYCGRVDANGNLLWSHKEKPGHFYNSFASVPLALLGGDVLWTFSQSDLVTYANTRHCLARLDSNGNFIWIKQVVAAVGDTLTQAIINTADDGTLVLLATLKSSNKTIICPIDDSSNIQTGKMFNLSQSYSFSKINGITGNLLLYGQNDNGHNVFIKTNWAATNCLESNYTLTTIPATFTSNGIVQGSGIFYFDEDTTLSFSMVNQTFSDSLWCTNTGTGFSEMKSADNLTLYPNPATNQLYVSGGSSISELNIYNITGTLVSQTKQPLNNAIEVSALPTGMYVAEIKTKESTLMRRWVKM